jgi:hypothetical protein
MVFRTSRGQWVYRRAVKSDMAVHTGKSAGNQCHTAGANRSHALRTFTETVSRSNRHESSFGRSHGNDAAANSVLNRITKRRFPENFYRRTRHESQFHQASHHGAAGRNRGDNTTFTRAKISKSKCFHVLSVRLKHLAGRASGQPNSETQSHMSLQILSHVKAERPQ